ncbi:hypothetical protein [Nocardiopsis alba]|uniref:hypothetical protein n=1 Tax=Nocardiopsis alba TaxID=53437 RepID=UPI0035DD9F7E
MDVSRLDEVRASLEASRFEVVEVLVDGEASERAFAAKVLSSLGLHEEGEVTWEVFTERIWGLYSIGGDPVVVLFPNFDEWLSVDLKGALGHMYGVITVFDSMAPEVDTLQRQLELVFFADWDGF